MRKHTLGLVAALVVTMVAASEPSLAGFCGDDVNGQRVPCDCGDVVASDTTLQADDPIIGKRCPFDGLRVRADALAENIVLNLNGLALVGSGRGAGVIVQRGGSDGAVIIGGSPPRVAEIAGFDTGLLVPNVGLTSRVERLKLTGNRRHGLWMRQAGAIVTDIVAERNRSHGISIAGSGGRFIGLRADGNGGKGIVIMADGAVISDSSAILNGAAGIVANGRSNHLHDVEAHGNKTDGIRATRGAKTTVERALAIENGRTQVRTQRDRRTQR